MCVCVETVIIIAEVFLVKCTNKAKFSIIDQFLPCYIICFLYMLLEESDTSNLQKVAIACVVFRKRGTIVPSSLP
jgi:hypothetical protein